MSADDASDDADDFDLPAVESDTVATGAAADSSDCDERLKGLPRLLRFVLMVGDNARHIEARLVAEIDELCPNLSLNAAWAEVPNVATGLALAAELDHRAVAEDDPNLRSFADCVRLLCLPTPHNATYFEPHRRVAKALLLRSTRSVATVTRMSAVTSSSSSSAGRHCQAVPTCCLNTNRRR